MEGFCFSKNWTSKANLDGVHIGRVYACSRTTPFLARDPRPLNPSESLLFHGTSLTPSQWIHHNVVAHTSLLSEFIIVQPISSARTRIMWGREAVEVERREVAASNTRRGDIRLAQNSSFRQINHCCFIFFISSSPLQGQTKSIIIGDTEVICAIIIRMRMWNHAWCSKRLICSEQSSSCRKISLNCFSWFQKGVDLLRPPQWALLKAG